MDHTPTAGGFDAIDDAFTRRLSARLRQARQMRGMTLKALADAAGCSGGLLSRFENGRNCPSLPMLGRIAQALDVDMCFLLDGQKEKEPVIYPEGSASDRLDLRGGVSAEMFMGQVEPLVSCCSILHIGPGRASAVDPRPSGEETGLVLEGHPSLIINGRSHQLDVGDAFAFWAEQPHGYQNAGATQARIFRVYTPSADVDHAAGNAVSEGRAAPRRPHPPQRTASRPAA